MSHAVAPHLAVSVTESPRRLKGIACVLFAVLVWAGWMVIGAYGVRSTLTAYDITALRFGTAGLVMLPVLWRKGWRVGPWAGLGGVLMSALMGAPYNTIAIQGMKYAPTSHLAIIPAVMLCTASLGGMLWLGEKSTKLKILGLLISLVGVGCLLLAAGAPENAQNMALGHAFFVLGALMWGIYALLLKKWKIDALHATAAVSVYSMLLYLPIYFLFLPKSIGIENWHAAAFQAVYQGIINSVLALLCFNRAVGILGAATASAFLPLIPALATLAAIPVFGEMPESIEWLGVALAGGGVVLSAGLVRVRRVGATPALG